MGVPNTYLFSRADGEKDYFGSPIHHKVIVKGLKDLNRKVWCFDEYPDGYFWPGRYTEMPGTTLWLGAPIWACDNVPQARTSAEMIRRNKNYGKKISAIPMGLVPEFTRLDEDGSGKVICLGWRAIFEKCIRARVASRRAVEKEFKINLQHTGPNGTCVRCQRIGVISRGHGIARACKMHMQVADALKAAKLVKEQVDHEMAKEIIV